MTTGLRILVENCSPGLGTGGEGAEAKPEPLSLPLPPGMPRFLGVLDAHEVGVRRGQAAWGDKVPTPRGGGPDLQHPCPISKGQTPLYNQTHSILP